MNEPIDAQRLAELLERHGGPLALYAAGWTRDAEDCVQEALVELARQPSVPENVVAWLYRVVRNRALNAARGSRRRRIREEKAARLRPAESASGAPLDPADALAVAEALDGLPPLDRQLVVLRIWGQLTWEEIATVAGLARTTACRRYRQALTTLKNGLEPPCSTKNNPHIRPTTGCRTS